MSRPLDDIAIVVNEYEYWNYFMEKIHKSEGWLLQETDIDIFKSSFTKFWYYVALEKSTKKPVSTVFLTYDEQEGQEPLYSIGVFYTIPEWRGTGIGKKLFSEVMKIVSENDKNATLHGVLKMAPRYASQFGFDKLIPFLHNNATIELKDITPPVEQNEFIAKKFSEVSWNDIAAYDLGICTRKREKFIKQFITPKSNTFTRIIVDSNKKIVGFACIRIAFGGDLAAGPVYAESKEAARFALDCILSEDVDKTKHQKIFFLYPSINTVAERILQELSGGHIKIEPFTQSQFTKHVIEPLHSKVFSISECAANFV